MDQLRRFLWPLAIGGAALIIALITLSGWILPEGHKVSSANAERATLLAQQTTLQAQISALEHESAREPQDCSDLRQDLTLVPGSPTVDLFLHQISQLATNSGTATPSVNITSSGTPGAGSSAGGADSVGIQLQVSGTYQQALNFLNGLDNVHSLQRLYSVSSITLSGGAVSGSTATAATAAYTLTLSGSIYYSSTNQAVCSTAPTNPASSST
jgi:hypothetical protein